MANPSVTYTFTNGTVADATQVNQNFTDLINGLTDGSKSLNVDAITAAGTATFNGDTVIGNASGDASTVNATMTFAATPKVDTIAEKTAAAGVTIDGVLLKDNTITASGGIIIGNETLNAYDEGTWTPSEVAKINLSGTSSFGAATYTRIGNTVFARIVAVTGLTVTSSSVETALEIATTGLPGIANGTVIYGTALLYLAAGPSWTVGAVTDSSGSTTTINLAWNGQATGQAQAIRALSFQYTI